MAAARLPVVFVPHGGGPLPLLGDRAHAPLTAFLRKLPSLLPAPRALLVISAHYEASKPTVSSGERPPMIYDYGGFPPESYKLQYPAPGDPQLAHRVTALLSAAGLPAAEDTKRGYDHGTFVPLMLSYPEATVPVVQLSLVSSLDPELHARIGRALAPLRQEGVLIYASGMSYHNMGEFMRAGFGGMGAPSEHSVAFHDFLDDAVTSHTGKERDNLLAQWASHPAGRKSHPREEHLLPLMVAAGAAGDDAGEISFSGSMAGAKVAGYTFGL